MKAAQSPWSLIMSAFPALLDELHQQIGYYCFFMKENEYTFIAIFMIIEKLTGN